MKKYLTIVAFLFISYDVHAVSIEMTAAGYHDKLKGSVARHGLSLRARAIIPAVIKSINLFAYGNFPLSPSPYDLIFGGLLRQKSKTFFEGGAGLEIHKQVGLRFAILGGLGHKISNRFYVVFPVIYRLGSDSVAGFEATPYLGYRF